MQFSLPESDRIAGIQRGLQSRQDGDRPGTPRSREPRSGRRKSTGFQDSDRRNRRKFETSLSRIMFLIRLVIKSIIPDSKDFANPPGSPAALFEPTGGNLRRSPERADTNIVAPRRTALRPSRQPDAQKERDPFPSLSLSSPVIEPETRSFDISLV